MSSSLSSIIADSFTKEEKVLEVIGTALFFYFKYVWYDNSYGYTFQLMDSQEFLTLSSFSEGTVHNRNWWKNFELF